MNILVTGATGFIGQALVKQLLASQFKTSVLVRNKNKVENDIRGRIEEAYEGDITDIGFLNSIVLNNAIDVIIHAAACIDYKAGRKELYRINAEGTRNLLNFAIRHKIKKFIFLSSVEAMGAFKKEAMPVNEDGPCAPINDYGNSKLEAEKLAFLSEKDLTVVALRLGNVYGPRSLSFVGAISNAILSKNKICFWGMQGRYAWHPVYIDDAVDGIIQAARKKDAGGIYILSGAEQIEANVLFQIISQTLSIDLKTLEPNGFEKLLMIFLKNVSKFKITSRGADRERVHYGFSIEKAKRDLDYSPKVRLKEGIPKTIAWAKAEGLIKVPL